MEQSAHMADFKTSLENYYEMKCVALLFVALSFVPSSQKIVNAH